MSKAPRILPPIAPRATAPLGCRAAISPKGSIRNLQIYAKAARRYSPGELFWIVKNGIKMSGMPAWSDHSDDELWGTVAFIEKLPAMSEADYAKLVMASLNQAGRHNHGGGNDAQSGASPEMDHGAMPGMPPMPGMAPARRPIAISSKPFVPTGSTPEDHQMRNPHRLRSTLLLVLLAFGGSLLFRSAASATLCAGLPPSTLLVYDIKASPPEMVAVSADRTGA